MTEPEITPVEVFAGTLWEATFVKSLLENAEIECFLRDEFQGMLAPWYAAPGGAGAVKVIVASTDAERAAGVVAEFSNSQ